MTDIAYQLATKIYSWTHPEPARYIGATPFISPAWLTWEASRILFIKNYVGGGTPTDGGAGGGSPGPSSNPLDEIWAALQKLLNAPSQTTDAAANIRNAALIFAGGAVLYALIRRR